LFELQELGKSRTLVRVLHCRIRVGVPGQLLAATDFDLLANGPRLRSLANDLFDDVACGTVLGHPHRRG
jgi:hypothetical protein